MEFISLLVISISGALLLTHACAQRIVPADYNKAFRPLTDDGSPLDIRVSMKINGIQDIDMVKMSVTIHMYLRVAWIDNRLIFPEEFMNGSGQVDSMSLHTELLKKIWNPDHFFRFVFNVKEFKLLQKFMGVKLFRSKEVFTSSMQEIEFGCPMSFKNYPFDTQECEISLGSYFYNMKEIGFSWDKLGLSIDDGVAKQLESYDFAFIRQNQTVCPCPGCFPALTPCIRLQLILDRHYLVHLLGYFIPSTMFMIVSWTSFFWPPEVIPGRTVLIITSLLTVSSLYASSRMEGPRTSYVKAIDAWMFFAMITCALSLFQYAILLQWLKLKEKAKTSAVRPVGKAVEERESMYQKYLAYERRTEQAGRIGVPILFLLFNLGYWITYF